MQHCLHFDVQKSPLGLTLLKPRFDFQDRFDTIKLAQALITTRRANQRWRFWTLPSSPLLHRSTVILSYLGNLRPPSSLVSIFWTDLTPLNMRKRWKHPAARVEDADFERNSLSLLYRPAQHLHSNSQFSRQPLTLFEPRFVIQDRFNTLKLAQALKTSRGASRRRRFWTLVVTDIGPMRGKKEAKKR